MTIWIDGGQDRRWRGSLLEQVSKWFCTHSEQLHRYGNGYFFTQECIQLLSKNETDDSNDADHKGADVCLRHEVTHLQHGLAEEEDPSRRMNFQMTGSEATSHGCILSYVDQRQRPVVSLRVDAKGIFELGHDHVNGGSCGVSPDQWLGQIGHQKTKLK